MGENPITTGKIVFKVNGKTVRWKRKSSICTGKRKWRSNSKLHNTRKYEI
jgi:hypothetical protein